jgi:hypothetical protein
LDITSILLLEWTNLVVMLLSMFNVMIKYKLNKVVSNVLNGRMVLLLVKVDVNHKILEKLVLTNLLNISKLMVFVLMKPC